MLSFVLIIVRVSLFVIIMETLHFLIKRGFSTSTPLGFGLCAFIIVACFLVAAIVDGRLKPPRGRRESDRRTNPARPALYPPRES
jgi:hypothetical protein